MQLLHELSAQPLFGITLTVLTYTAALALNRRSPLLHPLLMCSAAMIAFLTITGISYEDYLVGGSYISFLLGPATVALGVPLYKNAQRIGRSFLPILAGVSAGTVSALLLSAGLVWALGGSGQLLLSMLPKSVTAAVSIELSRQAGGYPELTAVLTVLTGLLGSILGPRLLCLAGVRDDISLGTAMGTASHGIGTARIIRDSELAGSVGGFAMGVAAILLSLLFIPLDVWLHG